MWSWWSCSVFLLLELVDGFSVPKLAASRTNLYTRSCLSSTVSSNGDLLPGIAAIDAANANLLDKLESLRQKPYFRLFSIDILASCEYMPQELFECYSETCEVYPVDEDEVPAPVRDQDFRDQEFELDGWARWDMPSDDYYDTEQFPEDYTGYDGSEVWNFIHNKIAFAGYGYDDDHWKADFNKAVSGLHSMVSAQIIRGIQDRVDNGEGFSDAERWTDPNAEFQRRLSPSGETPLAIENLYFTYMLLLAAAAKAKDRLMNECATGMIDTEAATGLGEILNMPLLFDPSVAVVSQKLSLHAAKDAASVGTLWEARMRARELLRIMNCVQCNKCRLHGKICVMGLSTALQILIGRSGEGGDPMQVHRVELATLLSTLTKFARAVKLCHEKQV